MISNGQWSNYINGTLGTGSLTATYQSNNTTPPSVGLGGLTGLWYDKTYSGSGFNIVTSSVGLLVTYYGWDATGNRLWLTSDIGPTTIKAGTAVVLNMGYTTGGNFANPQHNNKAWGSLSLTFTSCNKASATLSGADGTQNQALVLLVGLAGAPGC